MYVVREILYIFSYYDPLQQQCLMKRMHKTWTNIDSLAIPAADILRILFPSLSQSDSLYKKRNVSFPTYSPQPICAVHGKPTKCVHFTDFPLAL